MPDALNRFLPDPDAGNAPAAGNPGASQQWLARAVGDDGGMAALRQSALALNECTDWSRLDDHQVVDQLAPVLAAGRLAGVGPARPQQLLTLVRELPPAPPPPAPPASSPRAASAPAPAQADTTFDSELDVAAMVAVLVQAAQEGLPFCEECARAAAQAAA